MTQSSPTPYRCVYIILGVPAMGSRIVGPHMLVCLYGSLYVECSYKPTRVVGDIACSGLLYGGVSWHKQLSAKHGPVTGASSSAVCGGAL